MIQVLEKFGSYPESKKSKFLKVCFLGVFSMILAFRLTLLQLVNRSARNFYLAGKRRRRFHLKKVPDHILDKIPKLRNVSFPVNIFGFCKRLIGNVWQRLKNDGYENHL